MTFDLHNDFATEIHASDYAKYLDGRKDDIITAAIWTTEFEPFQAADRVRQITSTLSALDTPPPIAIEDIGFLCGTEYDAFDFSRYFYCTLTWNHTNGFAGGALSDGDLTADGKKVIAAMNGKCAVDLAHLNRKSFYSAIELAERPMCSHTGFNSHPRSLTDAQIRLLISRRGIIGISAVTAFTDAETIGQLAVTIDRFVSEYGINALCLGTDFFGTKDLPKGFTDYSDCDTLRYELSLLGYADGDIDKILYGNAQRFYEEIKNERHL